MAHTDAQEILGSLRDVGFPADKDELLRAATADGASDEALKALRGIPPDRYGNREEVARSVRVDPDSDLGHSASQRAAQARRGGEPGLSQHLRDAPRTPVEDEPDR
ncbi:DUF2795 domain-containing protein [Streptomyces sp. URMC 125]|uniref:DUF2795 domain-containing protein n=1 Tax=Streptomyces sp. URMC 125 TaxID=3423419 RepID=UPI003F1C0566